MKKVENLLCIIFGFVLKYLFSNIKTKDIVIIGSSSGLGFADNGMHLFLFCVKTNKKGFFVTKSFKLYKKLKKKYGSQVLYNYSYRGIKKILQAEYYFYTHNRGDVLFAFNNNTKKILLFHGMPIKCIGLDYKGKGLRKNKFIAKLYNRYAVGFTTKDCYLIVSTSPFFCQYLVKAWNSNRVAVLSYPRNNYLADKFKESRADENKLKTILYMPTHRDYGYGSLNPLIFHTDRQFQQMLLDYNYQLRYRFHPNMKEKLYKDPCFHEFKDKLDDYADAQDALLNVDILISDYSSCVFDFLICEKPIVFYHYDNYEQADNDIYYNVESLGIGPIAKNEKELKDILNRILSDEEYKHSLINGIKVSKEKYLGPTTGWQDYDQFFSKS